MRATYSIWQKYETNHTSLLSQNIGIACGVIIFLIILVGGLYYYYTTRDKNRVYVEQPTEMKDGREIEIPRKSRVRKKTKPKKAIPSAKPMNAKHLKSGAFGYK